MVILGCGVVSINHRHEFFLLINLIVQLKKYKHSF
jgi:hypothetical protein